LVHFDAIESGTERAALRMVSTEGLSLGAGANVYEAFVDREADTVCQPYHTPVGLVCIPGVGVLAGVDDYGLFYADAEGQEHLLPGLEYAKPSDIAVRRSEPASTECGAPSPFERIETAYPVGDRYDGPIFDEDGVEVDPSVFPDTAYYLIGPALDLASFGTLEESTE
jgi:hypothetical protein